MRPWMHVKSGKYRTGAKNFHDEVCEARMRRYAGLTDEAYAAMRYRDVLRFGFYELQSSRDAYRNAISKCGLAMHADTIKMYVDTLLVCISPVCPHFCDYMWRKVLGNEGHVMHAPWPTFEFDAVKDDLLLRSADYLSDLAAKIRVQILKDVKKNKKKKGAPAISGTPSAKVYIGLAYPDWKESLLKILGGGTLRMAKSIPR